MVLDIVKAFRISLERSETEQARLAAHLSDAERARMARYLVAHGVLREILAECLGITPIGLHFGEGPHGKPFLDPPGLNFSLSHSGELAMVAVSADRAVGIDIEEVRPDLDVLAIAERFFAPEEAGSLAAMAAAQRTAAFFALWTRKEAYSKARGMALAPALRESAGISDEWGVETIDAGEGYAAAVAYGFAAPFLRPNSNRRPRIILTIR